VLDLACGAGLVRLAVAERLPGRTVHYVGIDTSRTRLMRLEEMGATAALPAPIGGQPRVFPAASALPALRARLEERFVRSELDLHDPGRLAAELATLVGDERFDEIHVHLLQPRVHGAQPAGARVLRTLARRLRRGGRLYHLFQRASPLFDFQPRRVGSSAGDVVAPQTRHADLLRDDEERFRRGARRGGLLLDRCGHLWTSGRPRNEDGTWGLAARGWLSRPFTGPVSDSIPGERYLRLADRYSAFGKFATHFVILRRRRRRRGGSTMRAR